jgi:hypothetical protein
LRATKPMGFFSNLLERAAQSNIWPLKQSIFLCPALSSAAE